MQDLGIVASPGGAPSLPLIFLSLKSIMQDLGIVASPVGAPSLPLSFSL
jgi:hypothetical protein